MSNYDPSDPDGCLVAGGGCLLVILGMGLLWGLWLWVF